MGIFVCVLEHGDRTRARDLADSSVEETVVA